MSSRANSPTSITIKDIALKLGVSTASISNAFNRPDQLSSQLREHILDECKKLGYRSNRLPNNEKTTGCHRVIGLILAESINYNLRDDIANQFLEGVTEILDNAQYNVLMISARDLTDSMQLRRYQSIVDGFIVYGQPHTETIEQLTRFSDNLITVDTQLSGHAKVESDNFNGAFASAAHALKHTPKAPAIIGHKLLDSRFVCRVYDLDALFNNEMSCYVDRLSGYKKAFSEANIAFPAFSVWHTPLNNHAYARQAVLEALNSSPTPDLLICMTDLIAHTAIEEAHKRGLKVPQDIKVIGFDGLTSSNKQAISLTSVHHCAKEKGRISAKFVLSKDNAAETSTLPTKLIIGESCPLPN